MKRIKKRSALGIVAWSLLALFASGLIVLGTGPFQLVGDGLLALCLIKAGLKIHGHVIGGGPRRRFRFGTSPGPKPKASESKSLPNA